MQNSNSNKIALQATQQLGASASDAAELEEKLSAAQRRIQKQAEEQEEAEAARAQQGLHLTALQQDIQALQSALDRTKQDRQQVGDDCVTTLACEVHLLHLSSLIEVRPGLAAPMFTHSMPL